MAHPTEVSIILYADVPSFMRVKVAKVKEDIFEHDAAILGVPFDGVTTFRSGDTRLAPQEIRKYSLLFGGYIIALGINVLKNVRVVDYGDVDVMPGDTPLTNRRVFERGRQIVEAGAIPLVLGGDHWISYPVVKAVTESSNKKIGVIHFDTHNDLMDEFRGDRETRASPMKRIAELAGVKSENIVQIGIRGARNPEDQVLIAKRLGIKVFTIRDVESKGIESVSEEALRIAWDGVDSVYVTVDIDVVDPAFAPRTNSLEPGGLTSREIIQALRIVGKLGFAGFDIVEVAPQFDTPSGITSTLAARLVVEALGQLALKSQGKDAGKF